LILITICTQIVLSSGKHNIISDYQTIDMGKSKREMKRALRRNSRDKSDSDEGSPLSTSRNVMNAQLSPHRQLSGRLTSHSSYTTGDQRDQFEHNPSRRQSSPSRLFEPAERLLPSQTPTNSLRNTGHQPDQYRASPSRRNYESQHELHQPSPSQRNYESPAEQSSHSQPQPTSAPDVMAPGDVTVQMISAVKEMTEVVRSLVNANAASTTASAQSQPEPTLHTCEDERDDVDDSDRDSDIALELSVNSRSRQPKNVGIKLPAYTGREKWKVWFNRFSAVADRKQWTTDERLDELLPRLQGGAGDFVFGQLPQRVLTNYRALVRELDSRYRVVETTRTYGVQFSRRNQRGGETVEDYAAELKRLYDHAYPQRNSTTRQEDLLRRFLDGLQDDRTRFLVEFVKEPETIDDAVHHVVNVVETKSGQSLPDSYYDKRNKRQTRLVQSACHGDESSEDDGYTPLSGDEAEGRVLRVPSKPDNQKQNSTDKKVTFAPAATPKVADTSAAKSSTVPDDSATVIQQLLDRIATLESKGPQPQSNNTRKNQPTNSLAEDQRNNVCFNCHQPGHYSRRCPAKRRNQQWPTISTTSRCTKLEQEIRTAAYT
jgi:hypothetical protein